MIYGILRYLLDYASLWVFTQFCIFVGIYSIFAAGGYLLNAAVFYAFTQFRIFRRKRTKKPPKGGFV